MPEASVDRRADRSGERLEITGASPPIIAGGSRASLADPSLTPVRFGSQAGSDGHGSAGAVERCVHDPAWGRGVADDVDLGDVVAERVGEPLVGD